MMLLLLLARALAGEAALVGPTAPVAPGDPVSFTYTLEGVSWLDGCAPVELEHQEGDRWVAVARKTCSASLVATQVEGALVLSVPSPPVGTYRAAVTFGVGCVAGRTFPVAACQTLDFVRSSPFTVVARLAEPAQGR